MKFSIPLLPTTILGVIAMMTLTSCATSDSLFKRADSPLPIEARSTGGGEVTSYRASETSDRLSVSGSARQHALTSVGHVDIQLIDSAGKVISEKTDAIVAPQSAPGGGKRFTDSFSASFPLSDARKAAKVRITYHSGRDT